MKDLLNKIKAVSALDPVVVSATGQLTDIDLMNFDSAVLLISIGTDAGSGLSGSNKLVFTLSDSDDGSTYAAVDAVDVLGVTAASGVILTIDNTDEDNLLYAFGYVGGKRYLQLDYVETGSVSMPISILVVKGNGLDKPAI